MFARTVRQMAWRAVTKVLGKEKIFIMVKFSSNTFLKLLLILIFSGCYTTVKNDREPKLIYFKDCLTATTWLLISDSSFANKTLSFQKSGLYIINNCDECPAGGGTWELKDNRLIMEQYYDLSIDLNCTGNHERSYRYDIIEINKDKLVLKSIKMDEPPTIPTRTCLVPSDIDVAHYQAPIYTFEGIWHTLR